MLLTSSLLASVSAVSQVDYRGNRGNATQPLLFLITNNLETNPIYQLPEAFSSEGASYDSLTLTVEKPMRLAGLGIERRSRVL